MTVQDPVSAALVEAYGLLLSGENHLYAGPAGVTQCGLFEGGDDAGTEARTACDATYGQAAQMDPTGVPGLHQDASDAQRCSVGSAGQEVDRGGLLVAGIDLLGEGNRLLSDEDLEAHIGDGRAEPVGLGARLIATGGCEADGFVDGGGRADLEGGGYRDRLVRARTRHRTHGRAMQVISHVLAHLRGDPVHGRRRVSRAWTRSSG